jgi:anthranilate phosphoribosyltransferase
VHGAGLDEISLCGPTEVAALEDGRVRTFTVRPEDAGLASCDPAALRGRDVAGNAAIARAVLEGEKGPARDVVVLNAAAALVLAGRAGDLREGAVAAGQALDDGRAAAVLQRAREVAAS